MWCRATPGAAAVLLGLRGHKTRRFTSIRREARCNSQFPEDLDQTQRGKKGKKKKKNEYSIKMFTIRSVLTLLLDPPPASMEEPAQAPPCGSCRTKCKIV